jgi:hypothetical protein
MEGEKTLVIMRGLPSAGKSTRAKEILAEANGCGIIYSTDEYWYRIRKPDKPEEYSFNPNFLAHAHRWNAQRTYREIEMGTPLVIVDNTNVKFQDFAPSYVIYARAQGYKLQLAEPTTPWWLEIRELLRRKKQNEAELKAWAVKLAEKSLTTHRVPAFAIERMMWKWQILTEEEVYATLDTPPPIEEPTVLAS